MHEYFEYLFSDDYLAKGYDNINESGDNNLYLDEEYEFMNIRFDDILPLMYVTEDMSYEDAVLLESAYIQQTKHLNEFMGSGHHLYDNQIGVGATDWIPKATAGLSGPLKWLAALIAGTLGALFALLRALIKKGQQAVGVALLKRYITRIAAITDEGYKNMCKLWTSRKNRACFKTFQEASERDMIVSVDVCAKALGLYDNTLDYPEGKNPYWQAEEMISDVHNDYLKDVRVSRGFFGFNKLIDKPKEKIDNTNDYAEKYQVTVRHSPTKMAQSNHQKESWNSFDYSSYSSLNEYKDEEEHYGHTEHYAKTYDAYLTAGRVAWENLCKRLIGEIRIGGEVEYRNINKELNINFNNPKNKFQFNSNVFRSLKSYIESDACSDLPEQNEGNKIRTWIVNCFKRIGLISPGNNSREEAEFLRVFAYDTTSGARPWSKITANIDYYRKNQNATAKEKQNAIIDIWGAILDLLDKKTKNILNIQESVSFKNSENILFEKTGAEGVLSFRDEDIDNNLILQMTEWIQRRPQTDWKITKDFRQKCTELAAAVDNEIITRINRWTVPSGAPGTSQSPNKGYNSPITKAGLEKLWKAYKEDLNNRLEQRVDNFITGKPFNYALQFLQFTIPTLFKDLLNKVDPEDRNRNHENQEVTFDYNILTPETGPQLSNLDVDVDDDTVETEFDNFEFGDDLLNIHISNLNESWIYFKGYKLNEALLDPDDVPEEETNTGNDDNPETIKDGDEGSDEQTTSDSDNKDDETKEEQTTGPVHNPAEEKEEEKKKDWTNKINGYTMLYAFIPRSDVKSCVEELSNLISSENNPSLMSPNKNIILRDSYTPMQFLSKLTLDRGLKNVYQHLSCYKNSPKFIISWSLEENKGNITTGNDIKEFNSNKNSELNEFFSQIKKTLNPDNKTGEKETKIGSKTVFSDYVIVKFPIFWFGQMMVKPSSDQINPDNVIIELNEPALGSFVNYINNVSGLDHAGTGIYWPVTIQEAQHICYIPKAKNESLDEVYEDETALYEAGFLSNFGSKLKNFGKKLSDKIDPFKLDDDDDLVADNNDEHDYYDGYGYEEDWNDENNGWDDLDGFSGNLHDIWNFEDGPVEPDKLEYPLTSYYSLNSELGNKFVLVLDDKFTGFNIKDNNVPDFYIDLTINPAGHKTISADEIDNYLNNDEIKDYDSVMYVDHPINIVNFANKEKLDENSLVNFVLGSRKFKPHMLINFNVLARYVNTFNFVLTKQETDFESLKKSIWLYIQLFSGDGNFKLNNVLGAENNKYKKNSVQSNKLVMRDKPVNQQTPPPVPQTPEISFGDENTNESYSGYETAGFHF